MVECFADLGFWFVLQIGSLGPVEGDRSSRLKVKYRTYNESLDILT